MKPPHYTPLFIYQGLSKEPRAKWKVTHGLEDLKLTKQNDHQNKQANKLPSFFFKSILRQKKNYENSNIYFTMQKYKLQKKILSKKPKSFKDIIKSITNLSSFNKTQNIIFQKILL
jgi:hypothetical protein